MFGALRDDGAVRVGSSVPPRAFGALPLLEVKRCVCVWGAAGLKRRLWGAQVGTASRPGPARPAAASAALARLARPLVQ